MDEDLIKIFKLLSLTTSENDHECLLAIRSANGILKKYNKTWLQLIEGSNPYTETKQSPHPPRASSDDRESVTDMFDFIFEYKWESFETDFVESLQEQYEKKGSLSDKQRASLKKVFDTVFKYASLD